MSVNNKQVLAALADIIDPNTHKKLEYLMRRANYNCKAQSLH